MPSKGSMPLPPITAQKRPLASEPKEAYSPPPTAYHSALRNRNSEDDFSDDDPKTQHRFAQFFSQHAIGMDGYTALPPDLAVKLAEADRRFSVDSRRSMDSGRSYETNDEIMDIASKWKGKARDSGISTKTIEEIECQLAHAVELKRATRKSWYPPPRSESNRS